MPGPEGHDHAGQLRAHPGLAVGQQVQRHAPLRAHLGHQRVDAVGALDDGVVLGDRRRRGRAFGGQRSEAERRKQRVAALARGPAERQRRGVELHRHVRVNRHQLAAGAGVGRVGQQRLALLFRLHLAGPLQQGVERPVGGDEVARALLADAGHALHVVGGVAHDGEHVDHLRGQHAELRPHAFGIEPRAVVFRVVDADRPLDELEEVLVAGDDRHLVALRRRLAGQRADDVVGLEALVRQDRHAHRLAGLVHPRDLLLQILRHRGAVGLVLGGDPVAEGVGGEVERGGDEPRLVVGQQLPEHRHEPVDRVGRPAVGPGETTDRVVGAIHLVAAVDEEERPRL